MSPVADARPSGRGARSPTPTEGEPAQPSLRRMRRFEVRPDRELGQNFLIDSNILGVIERAAELAASGTSCWRSAGGWGCCPSTWRSACDTCTSWRSTSASARGAAASDRPASRTSACTGAMRCAIDLAAMSPAPGKMVANLPYGIAAGVLLRTIEELAGRRRCGSRWCSARSASGWPRRRAGGCTASAR